MVPRGFPELESPEGTPQGGELVAEYPGVQERNRLQESHPTFLGRGLLGKQGT